MYAILARLNEQNRTKRKGKKVNNCCHENYSFSTRKKSSLLNMPLYERCLCEENIFVSIIWLLLCIKSAESVQGYVNTSKLAT